MPANKVTYKEYLEWMAKGPRTNKWSAFVAYDRDKCNQLLRQEYNEKFDKGSYIPPISESYLTGETTWKYNSGLLLDAPRLSFENNVNDDTSAETNMSVKIFGGTEVYLTSANGAPEVLTVRSFDPLDYPELEANRVLLKDVKGHVDQAGEVVLDLGDPAAQRHIWELKGSRIEHERRVGGAFFKRLFREADPERRTYHLGRLAHTDQDFLKPSKFKIRTMMEAGAHVKNAPNFGNGVVELRIAMKNELEGGAPGEDWLYPIPSDKPEINSSLMISNKLLMAQILGQGVAAAFDAPNVTFDEFTNSAGFIDVIKVQPTSGVLKIPTTDGDIGKLRFRWFDIPLYKNADHLLTITYYGQGKVRVGMGAADGGIDCGVWLQGDMQVKQFKISAVINGDFSFKIDPDTRKISVNAENFNVSIKVTERGELPAEVESFINRPGTDYHHAITESCKAEVTKIFGAFEAIDAFVLHSLIFNSADAVALQTVDVTGDLLSFGTISPRLTTFEITDQEKLLGYGGQHTFATSPVVPSVEWSVQNLDGSSAGAGQIDKKTGQYTAPGLADISGTFKRVKVIATDSAGTKHISKTLVTVAARAITLNPIVETCNAQQGPDVQTWEFSANTLSGSLKWEVIGDGTIPATAQGKNLYTPPPKEDMTITKRSFTVDQVKVTNTSTQQTQNSFVIVKHNKQTLSMTRLIEASGKAQFNAKSNGQDLPAPPAWGCIPEVGAGSIDQNGLYTADPDSQHQFVIITVRSAIGDFFWAMPFTFSPCRWASFLQSQSLKIHSHFLKVCHKFK